MKYIKIILIISILNFFTNCSRTEIVVLNKSCIPIDSVLCLDGSYRTIYVYTIDSCEYIGYINAHFCDFLSHKGNCKNH